MSLQESYMLQHLEPDEEQEFIKYYERLPEKTLCTIRFFALGELYLNCGEDVQYVSNFIGNPISYMGNTSKLPYVLVNKKRFEDLIRDILLVRQYRAEVYTKSGQSQWSLKYKGSPGNLSQFEDVLYDLNTTTLNINIFVMGIKIANNNLIGLAAVNTTEMRIEVCEFQDNECLTELEAIIAQIGPRECVIPNGQTNDIKRIKTLLDRNNVMCVPVKGTDFHTNHIIEDLNRLLYFPEHQQRQNADQLSETDLKHSMASLQAIVKYLNLIGNETNFNQYRLETVHLHRFVRLDNAALYALNVFPKVRDLGDVAMKSVTKSFSLIGLLDHCVTNQGKRLLEVWIKQPLRDRNLISERLDVVECLMTNSEVHNNLRTEHLARTSDLLPLSKKFAAHKANLHDCFRVYQVITYLPHLLKTLGELKNVSVNSLIFNSLKDLFTDLSRFVDMIREIMDLDAAGHGEYIVKKTYDPKLHEISEKKQWIHEKIQKLFKSTADDLGLDSDKTIKLEFSEQYGFYFRVTMKEEPVLRKSKKYQIVNTLKNGVWFTNDRLTTLNSNYEDARKQYEQHQESIVTEISDVAVGYAESLRHVNYYVAALDVLVAFAVAAVSSRIPYVRPRLRDENSGILRLDKVRHACIEALEHVNFVPNSISFGENGKNLHIITGPNMCGKSTFIRSVGLAVLMAHIGSFVPCQFAEISLVDAILARVGADDCQLKGLSTFMLEMMETSTMCNTATSNSLVIIDELGRGTSTYDGCGIAMAIAEYFATEVKAYSMFATHFFEITRLEDLHNNVNNIHVTAVTQNNTMTALFQVLQGRSDNSYGIHCARMVDFPDDVIQTAVEYQNNLENAKGMRLLKDLDAATRTKIVREGDEIIKDALKKVQTWTKEKDENQLKESIGNLKTELLRSGNLFIEGMLK